MSAAAEESSDISEIRNDLHRYSLGEYQAEFAEHYETWRELERKAQASIGLAGVFLAATFAYARQVGEASPALSIELLLAVLATLILTVMLALVSMWLRQIPAARRGDVTHQDVRALIDSVPPDQFSRRQSGIYIEKIRRWRRATETFREINQGKARWVAGAQFSLMISIVLAVLLTARLVSSAH